MVQDFTATDIARQGQIDECAIVVCVTICAWDWLLAAYDEYRMTCGSKHLFAYLSDTVYFISRASSLTFLVTLLVICEAQVNDCQPIAKLLAVARVFASTTTAALFLFRVSAVYSNKKAIVALFCSLWLALVGVYIIDNIHITKGYAHIPGTKYCIQLNKLDAMAALSNAIYDTLIYLAISWRMASFSVVGHNWTARIKSFFRGDGLLDLSKSLLRSGQIYYFTTIGFNVCLGAAVYAGGVDRRWKEFLSYPNIAIQSVMACRVFRELKTGALSDHTNQSESYISDPLECSTLSWTRMGVRHPFELCSQSDLSASSICDAAIGSEKSIMDSEKTLVPGRNPV